MRSSAIKVGRPEAAGIDFTSMFAHARAKIYGARLHTHNLSIGWEGWVEHNANVIAGVEAKAPGCVYDPLNIMLPIEALLAVGDAVHSIRSSLDYLISALARRASMSDSSASFPLHEKRAGVEAAFVPPKGGKSKGATTYRLLNHYPDLKSVVVDVVRPFPIEDGGSPIGDLLWRIGGADNIDKHRLIMPVAQSAFARKAAFNNPMGGSLVIENIGFHGGSPFDLSASKPDPYNDLTFDMLFSEPTRLADKPVLSALVEGCEAAEEVVKIFEAHFEGK